MNIPLAVQASIYLLSFFLNIRWQFAFKKIDSKI